MRTRSPLSLLSLLVVQVLVVFPVLAQDGHSLDAQRPAFTEKLVAAAFERTHHVVRYDPAYVRIPYPSDDVPANTGVCTDEIIRTYRAVGIDV
jgi:uncharacterized protein